ARPGGCLRQCREKCAACGRHGLRPGRRRIALCAFLPEYFSVRAALVRCWLRRPSCALTYAAGRLRSARNERRVLHRARLSPGRSRRLERVCRERPDCRTLLSCARSLRRSRRLRQPPVETKNLECLRLRCPRARQLRRSRGVCPGLRLPGGFFVASLARSLRFLCGLLRPLWL